MHWRPVQVSVKRFVGVFSAEVYSQAIALAVPLVQMPVLLVAWGERAYGEWLVFSAIMLYLITADFGYTYSAKNAMTVRAAAGDANGALRVYQSVFILLGCAAAAAVGLVAVLVSVLPVNDLLRIHETSVGDARVVILLLVGTMLLHHLLMLQVAAVRCIGRPALEVAWVATTRLLELGSVCATALMGGDLVAAAVASVVVRTLSSFALALWLQRMAPWLKLGTRSASLSEIRALLHPSIGYMLLPLSQTLLTQGPVLILASYGSSSLVVLYSASRTLARLGMAGTTAVNSCFIAEYSYSLGQPSARVFKSIAGYHTSMMAVAVAGYAAIMFLFSGQLLSLVTAGKVDPRPDLLLALAAAVVLEMVWSAGVAPLTVMGRHTGSAYALAILSGVSILLSIPATQYWGIMGPPLIALGVHSMLTVFIALELARLRSFTPRWTALGAATHG